MNDLEKELRSLEPSSPSRKFEDRLEKALGEPGNLAVKRTESHSSQDGIASNTFVSWLIPLSVAAAVVLGAFLSTTWIEGDTDNQARSNATPQDIPKAANASILPSFPGQGWKASELTDHFLGARDEGVVHREGEVPARRYRYRFLDVTTWEHPQANAVIKSSVPREEVVLVGLDAF